MKRLILLALAMLFLYGCGGLSLVTVHKEYNCYGTFNEAQK